MILKRSVKKERNSNRRMQFLVVAVFLSFIIIFFRLCQLQILKHGFYSAMAQGQHQLYEKIVPHRGQIFIRDDASGQPYPVAVNKEMNLVYAVPRNIEEKDKASVAKKVSEKLQLDYGEVLNKLSKPDDYYEVLKKKVTDEDANAIEKENLNGIGIAPDTFRYYPGGELAANIIGFLGYNDKGKVGQYGIEGFSEKDLAGSAGFLEQEKDTTGNWISFGDKTLMPAKNGKDIVLTIDYTVQYLVEQKLKEAVEKYGAEGGSIILMNPKTGEIIAMADYPTYDLNKYSEVKDMKAYMNPAVQDVFEPGSIEKTITMAIGIDTGKVSPTSVYFDTGLVKIDSWSIQNSDLKGHGQQTMTQVLEKSLNTGSIFVQQQVDKKVFYNYLKNFGLGNPTGIEMNGEVGGNITNLDTYKDINYATASFGQGISVTPLEILTAISSFANDGKLMKPYIIDSYIDPDGSVEKSEPKVVRQVVSAKTANQVAAMMVSVTKNGTAKGVQIPGYEIAGKTGTAQIPDKDNKGYLVGKTIHTFVGFGPLPNAKFSGIVKLDAPKAVYAESTSVKVFKEIEDELVKYYHLAPTEEVQTKN
jgi:stage V sporulation protein D (sporulation-specific penicillin-binding protein)